MCDYLKNYQSIIHFTSTILCTPGDVILASLTLKDLHTLHQSFGQYHNQNSAKWQSKLSWGF